MEKIATSLPDVWILEPKVFGDYRGYFMETYNRETFASLGIHNDWVQDNQSFTQKKGHPAGHSLPDGPHAQCKIVRVTRGAVKDLAVDRRKGSPTYKKGTGGASGGEQAHASTSPGIRPRLRDPHRRCGIRLQGG